MPVSRRALPWAVLGLVLCLPAGARCADPVPGLIVLEAKVGGAAAAADLRPDDRLVRWRREAAPPANPEPAGGTFTVPGDLDAVQLEEAPRGPTTLELVRDGRLMEARMPTGQWLLEVRPDMEAADLEAFAAARRQIAAPDDAAVTAGFAAWRALAERWRDTRPQDALWLNLTLAGRQAGRRRPKEAGEAIEAAQAVAERLADATALAHVALARARTRATAGDYPGAVAAYDDALTRWRRLKPDGLMVAYCLSSLGILASDQSRLADANRLHLEAAELRQRAAPDGLEVGASQNNLAVVAGKRGDYEAAEVHLRRTLDISRRLTPGTTLYAAAVMNLGIVERHLGKLAEAESDIREAMAIRERLQPESLELARVLDNLANTLRERGHLLEAERLLVRAAELAARYGTARDQANMLSNQALVEQVRGDRRSAAALYERALALQAGIGMGSSLVSVPALLGLAEMSDPERRRTLLEQVLAILQAQAPDGIELTSALGDLGVLAKETGRPDEAERLLEASLKQARRLAPGSLNTATALQRLGVLALEKGDLEAAESHLREALAICTSAYPGSQEEALTLHALGRVLRRRGRAGEARAILADALESVDSQLGVLGGSTEDRSRYRAAFADLHFEMIDLLVELGEGGEAFRVLEAWRARELLAALSQRDTALPELPPELDRRRRIAEARYRRLLGELQEATVAERGALLEKVVTQRRDLAEIDEAIRTKAPRVARLRAGSVLDLAAAHGALEPGTLLLSFAVGESHSFVFAAGAGSDDFAVHRIAAGRRELAGDVDALRLAASRRSLFRGWVAPAERLSRLLLSPVAARIARADRLLVLPDGALHFLPFAALPLPGTGGRTLLIEKVPLHFAASATVFAELAARRRPGRKMNAVAFADPEYSGAEPGAQRTPDHPEEPRPLPGTRREVLGLRDLLGPGMTLWMGREATEERVKRVGTDVSHLHLACHGLADPRSPLDSSLALAARAGDGTEDGLLQAWEVFEQLRLDADLVVLSACDTALGEELQGEGVLGLTRGFQFAGARAVLSTQWTVDDASTPLFMKRFYGGVRAGLDTAESLRRAQLATLHRRATSHPFYWASFQLDGDWR
jgi:CHAT domain-containing protein